MKTGSWGPLLLGLVLALAMLTLDLRHLLDLAGPYILALPIAVGGWISFGRYRRSKVIEAERRELRSKIEHKMLLVNGILDNIDQGVCIYDKDLRLSAWSQGFVELFHLSEAWLGTRPTLEEFMRFNAERGDYREADIDEKINQRLELAGNALEPHHYQRTRADGSVLDVRGEPMPGGGLIVVYKDISEAKRARESADRLDLVDSLTGLPNRSALDARLTSRLAEADSSGDQVSVMCLDLDHFKDINDSLGHAIGDKLLIEVAERLKRCAGETDLIARLGADRFAIVGGRGDNNDDPVRLARRIVKAFEHPAHIGKIEVRSTASIGITIYPGDRGAPDELFRHAEVALFSAKRAGRNNFQVFEPSMGDTVQDRGFLEHEMVLGMERGEFEPYYQPKINVETGAVVGAEALMRWHNPERGMIPPLTFIPVAEKSGLIIPMSKWMLETACAEAKAWRDLGFEFMTIAVNISAVHFKSSDFVRQIEAVLRNSGLEPEYLELEITEGVVMSYSDEVIATLAALRDLGVKVSIDDFGTGYSSPAHLKRFPVHSLKIDQSFISDLDNDDDAAIVKTIVSMGQTLGMTVVAEGVESARQYSFLKLIGCDQAQGYYFSRPVPSQDFRRWVAERTDNRAAVRA